MTTGTVKAQQPSSPTRECKEYMDTLVKGHQAEGFQAISGEAAGPKSFIITMLHPTSGAIKVLVFDGDKQVTETALKGALPATATAEKLEQCNMSFGPVQVFRINDQLTAEDMEPEADNKI